MFHHCEYFLMTQRNENYYFFSFSLNESLETKAGMGIQSGFKEVEMC